MLSPVARRSVALVTALSLLATAVLVTLAALQFGTSSAAVDPREAVTRADGGALVRAAFLGDSITVGNSDLSAGRLGDQSWFHDLVTGDDPAVAFAGGLAENGRTTDWMAEHVGDALAYDPDLLVVLGGTNDASIGIPADEVAENLHRIADATDRAGVRLALATLPPLDVSDDAGVVAQVNAAIREVAADRGAVLLDVGAAVTGEDGRWLPGLSADGIHPLAEGAAVMAAAAARALRSVA